MNNRYPAPCRHCGGTVPPGTGLVEKVGPTWRTAHPACARRALSAVPQPANTAGALPLMAYPRRR